MVNKYSFPLRNKNGDSVGQQVLQARQTNRSLRAGNETTDVLNPVCGLEPPVPFIRVSPNSHKRSSLNFLQHFRPKRRGTQ